MRNYELVTKYIMNKMLRQKFEVRKEIFYVQMNVTDICTEDCKHCYLKEKRKSFFCDEMNALDLINVLRKTFDYVQRNSRKLVVDLIGGDPLAKPDIYTIIEYLYENKIEYGIKGNPDLLFDNIVQLVKMNIKHYQMSLDGLEKNHDWIRSKGSFKTTISAIQLLNEYQVPVYIKFTLSDVNSKDLWPLLYELYERKVKIDSFSVARYFEKGDGGFHTSKEYYDEAYERIIAFYRMQIENHDIRIHINLKEHLWIPYLLKKGHILKECYDLIDGNPYLSSCSILSNKSMVITCDGYYDICPKMQNFNRTKKIDDYMEKKNEFISEIIEHSCNECIWKKYCLGCPAFHTDCGVVKDCDCFLFEKRL